MTTKELKNAQPTIGCNAAENGPSAAIVGVEARV